MQIVVSAGVVDAAGAGVHGAARVPGAGDGYELLQPPEDGAGVVVKAEELAPVPVAQLVRAGDEAAEQLPVRQGLRRLAIAPQVVKVQAVEDEHDVYVAALRRLAPGAAALYADEAHPAA